MNYKNFLYRIEEINHLKRTGLYSNIGLLSPEENAQKSNKMCLKLISSRLSFSQLINVTPSNECNFYNILDLKKDHYGKPIVVLSDYFYQSLNALKLDDLLISFSYQSGYIACGFVYTLEGGLCVV